MTRFDKQPIQVEWVARTNPETSRGSRTEPLSYGGQMTFGKPSFR